MASPNRLRARSAAGPVDRCRDDAPDETGAGELSDDAAIDGQLSRDGRFRWSAGWDLWVPTGKGEEIDLPGPLEWGPLMPDKVHAKGCWCVECWNAGVRYGDYLKAKRIRDANGF